MGPRIENVEKPLVLPLLFEGSREPRVIQEQEKRSEPERAGSTDARAGRAPQWHQGCGLP